MEVDIIQSLVELFILIYKGVFMKKNYVMLVVLVLVTSRAQGNFWDQIKSAFHKASHAVQGYSGGMYASYAKQTVGPFGIDNMNIELKFTHGNITVPIIHNRSWIYYDDTTSSEVLGMEVSKGILIFKLAYVNDELHVSTQNQFGDNDGFFVSNFMKTSKNIASIQIPIKNKIIADANAKMKKDKQGMIHVPSGVPGTYQVIINGQSHSAGMSKSFYIEV